MRAVKEKIEAEGYSLGDDFVDRWYQAIPIIFENGVEAIPHIEDVIAAVKKAELPYCVASSANVEKMHITLGKTGLIEHFQDVLYSASMVARGKPFPDLFLHAAKEMGYEPSQVGRHRGQCCGNRSRHSSRHARLLLLWRRPCGPGGSGGCGRHSLRRHAPIARIAGNRLMAEPLKVYRYAHGR